MFMVCEELEETGPASQQSSLPKKLAQNAQICIKMLPFTNVTSKTSLVELLSRYLLLALTRKLFTIVRLRATHGTLHV